MKFIHTADWHVGKTLKGRSRFDEQTRVLKEIVQLAISHRVDAVLVSGDLYDSVAPTAEAQQLVVRTLMELAKRDIEVVAIAGNHDHGRTLEAYRPLMEVARIQVRGAVHAADAGGLHSFTARSTGERCTVAMVPFLSQRWAVRAAQVLTQTAAENVGDYEQQLRDIVASLTAALPPDSVNVIMAHLTCTDGLFGGGERLAQSIFEYHVPASIFPAETHYVALGHLHRRQQVPAACPVHYSGSPFPVDFGEQEYQHVVCLVEASPGSPAKVTDLPLTSGRRLRTVTGTVAELATGASSYGDDFLRVVVTEPARAGLRDEIFAVLPNALEVRIHPDHAATAPRAALAVDHARRSPAELFAEFCADERFADPRVNRLFDEIADDLTTAESAR